eukprot:296510-Chlamydomonas_euryale.AAC.2
MRYVGALVPSTPRAPALPPSPRCRPHLTHLLPPPPLLRCWPLPFALPFLSRWLSTPRAARPRAPAARGGRTRASPAGLPLTSGAVTAHQRPASPPHLAAPVAAPLRPPPRAPRLKAA